MSTKRPPAKRPQSATAQTKRPQSAAAQKALRKGASSSYRSAAKPRSGWGMYVLGALVGAVALVIVTVLALRQPSVDIPSGPSGTVSYDGNALNHNHSTAAIHYNQTPPVGGDHNPVPQTCGIYDQPIQSEHAVHSMEHGTVWVTYDPSLPNDQLLTLRQTISSNYDPNGRYIILSPFPGLPSKVVASAWGKQLKLNSVSDPRLVEFIKDFRSGPQAREPGATCYDPNQPGATFGTPSQ